MSGRARYLLPLVGLWLVPPVFATDIGSVKCAVNQDRVWVYESLNSFDVEARLRCGEAVEIVSRVKGFVKIRTASGVEGYVPDSAFPDLPALPDDTDKTPAGASVARAAVAVKPSPVVVPVAPAVAPVPQPSVTPSAPLVAAQPSAPTIAAQPAAAASAAPLNPSSSATASPAAKMLVASTTSKPASAPSTPAHKAPVKSTSAASAPTAHTAVAVSTPAAPAKASIAPVSATMKTSAPNASLARDVTTLQPAASAEDPDDYPDAQPENESADPACRVYFSAYGLTPSQYKWLAENRKKEFAAICPAPDLARVDYVILFAHDSDSYTDAMPTPVHTDRNGFSDFSPLTTVDTALVSASELDKARYEFVWVFRMKRGEFDPSKFSLRRRPQFTTDAKGSHASTRSVEDAFHFIEQQPSAR
jgi:hypothetical protein